MAAALRLVNRHTGETLEFRRGARDGREIFLLRGTLPPHRQGPPLHRHFAEDEEGVVLAGTLTTEVGGARRSLGPGERAHLPRGVPHRWWNDGEAPLAFEGVVDPAVDLDRYLQAIFDVMNAGAPDRPSLFYLARVALRHRRTQEVLILPRAVRAILFPAVVVLGTLLGKYRGTAWPGCAARCSGVPAVR